MLLSQTNVKEIADRILRRSKAESCVVSISGGSSTNVRFANGSATTNGTADTLSVRIQSSFGQRSGWATVTGLDDGFLVKAQERSEEIARLAPPNPEFLPPLGPQVYEPGDAAYDAATAAARSGDIASSARSMIEKAEESGVSATGYGETTSSFSALATSAGLFAYDRRTGAEFTITATNALASWRGWACTSDIRFGRLMPGQAAERAIGKANFDAAPYHLEPGKYTVILEPAAVADLVGYLLWYMDARSADEGRSFMSRKGGGTKLGERLLDERVTVTSDPQDPVAPESTFGADGLPQRRTAWIEDGIVKNLIYSRYWAQKSGREPLPNPRCLVMAGGSTSVEDMIRDTKRGILVTRLWYIRTVDPQTLLLTGMTRDGNFLIENGRIAGPARNMRFNESPISALNNIIALGPAERTAGSEVDSGIAVPPLLIKEFTFSSKSSGI